MNKSQGAPVPVQSISALLAQHSNTYGTADAIVSVDPDADTVERLTYKRLEQLVRRTAFYLKTLGIGPGIRVAILMHNAPEVILIELAAALLGATTVPLDIKRDTIDRKQFKLNDTHSRVLLAKLEDHQQVDQIEILKKEIPGLHIALWSTLGQFETMLPNDELSNDQSVQNLSHHYVVLYTSGTTALPKGTLLTARACLTNAMGIAAWQHFTHEDRFHIVLPLHHINSTIFSLAILLVGGTIVLNSRYSASKFWDTIATHKATNTSIVPTILHDLLTRKSEFLQKKYDLSNFKRICIGSAPVLPEETLRFYETFGIRVVQGYGQTETALRVAGVPVDISDREYRECVRTNTIGTELANNELEILDDEGKPVAQGSHGEICIKGPVLADGYLNNPDETAKAFMNGWFRSGDLGYWKSIRGTKYFFIVGRKKEIIIKGGVNISPSAIEDALLSSLRDIDEASVVGYHDSRMGEEIAAVVVCRKRCTVKEILDTIESGNVLGLTPYEYPKKIFIVDSLPKTSTGKIQRVEVKKMVAQWTMQERQKHYYVRRIEPEEKEHIARAVGINNKRWIGMSATLDEFVSRAKHGILYGAFEETEGLVGSLSCVQMNMTDVKKLTSWNEATTDGRLTNHNPGGDTLVCVAISVQPHGTRTDDTKKNNTTTKNLTHIAKKHIGRYVQSGKDHVLSFHAKPKAGLPGATVWKILENGRPEDIESVGYNVLMKYPDITADTRIVRSRATSPSVLLIEHALLYAKQHGIRNVIAFSRPSGFRKYLLSLQG